MKKLMIVLLSIAFSMSANAASFMCRDYTDTLLKADAGIRSMVTNVRTDPKGYTVSQNGVFKKTLMFTNPRFDQLDKFASNPDGMIYRKVTDYGKPYFIVMINSKPEKVGEKPGENPIQRIVTLGNCTER